MTAAGKPVRRLAAHGYAATWSPDGKKIAYTWQNAIYVIPSLGGKATKLTTAPAGCGDYHPKWSPRSNTDILFTRSCSTDTFLIVNTTKKAIRFVTQDGAKGPADRIDSIDWMPDGKHLAITSYCQDYGVCNKIAENVFTTDLTDSHRINVTNEVDEFPDPSDCETQMVDCWGGYYNAIPAPDGKDFIVEWSTPSGMGATVFSTLRSKFYTDDGNGVLSSDPSWQRLK
jgi:hypothetical protein